jgi:hypothetical protein
MNQETQTGESSLGIVVGVVLLISLLVWQIHMGATVKKIGIPGIFEIEIGAKPNKFCIDVDRGYDRNGSDYNGGVEMSGFQQCNDTCLIDENCKAFSFNASSSQCWLKTDPGLRQPNSKYIAGVKRRC